MKAYTYIVTNPKKSTLYTGVTNNLQRRLVEHYINRGTPDSFAGRYYCYCLIWYEAFLTMHEAIEAEKYIKGKKRAWKVKLINRNNPDWNFMNKIILGEWPPDNTLPTKSS